MTFDTTEQATLPEPERLCCDALAELFLGETGRPEGGFCEPEATPASGEAEATAALPLAREPEAGRAIEAVLAGHLPVMASAWVSQYARGLAQQGEGVGLVRASGGRLSVEVFGASASHPSLAPGSAAEAVALLRPAVGRWLVQVDIGLAGALLDRGDIDRLTLLCSADEASLVAGYRTVKELLEPRIELAAPAPAVHIAIAGRADAEAMAAAERLSRAAERFLGVESTVAVGAARIEAGASASWFEGAAATSELLAQLADIISEGGSGEALPEAPSAARAPEDELPSAIENGWPAIFGPGLEQAGDPEPAPASNGVPVPAAPEAAPPAAAEAPGALPLRCPRAPAIEFRIEDGGLVAIADARGQNLDLALRQLMIASAWAAENHALIAMAIGLPGPLAQRVLLVEDAAAARPLLDAEVRVRVAAAGRAEIPLN